MVYLILIYLITLIIAPQLWLEPFVGIRTDLIVYPVWLVAIIASGRFNKLIEFRTQDKYLVMFVVWLIVSILLNGYQEEQKDLIISYIKWLVLYKLVIASIDNFDDLKKVFHMIVFFGLLMAIEGIQHKLGSSGLGWAGQSLGWVDPRVLAAGGTGRTQWINIFDGPGVFCVIYTLALPFLLQFLGKPFNKQVNVLALLLLWPLLVAIYYTGSRGGLLATAALIGLYFLVRFKVSVMKIMFIGIIGMAAVMVAPDHITSIRDPNKSAQHRVDMWGEGIEMVQQNPIAGIGRGNFVSYTGRLIAHNSAIEIMGEMGIVGFFFWCAVIYLAFKSIYRYRADTEDPVKKAYIVGLGLSLVGYIISSMFVTLEYETFYFLLALCASTGRLVEGGITYTRQEFIRTWKIMFIFFILLKGFVMWYY